MRIVGLDVCKLSVVVCLLDENHLGKSPRDLYYDLEFPKLYANVEGLLALLAMKPDIALLEPTGTNYSKLWISKLAENGVQVYLVGHKQLRSYRENLGLPDKDDSADALALAMYYLEHEKIDSRFVRTRDSQVARMRDICLRFQHLNRIQSPVINRVRQDLAWQFPEAASINLNAPLFWGWLAGTRKSARYDAMLSRSIGLGLKPETKSSALMLCTLRGREQTLEREMRSLLSDLRFLPYRKVFAEFGFGQRIEALILSQIFPFSNYMGEDGTPEIKIRKGRNSGKPTKRYLSLRRFQKSLGVAPTREDSGDSRRIKKAGSQLCRTALWQWIFTRIEPNRISSLHTETILELKALMAQEKSCKPVKLARSRVAAKASVMLFKKLVNAIIEE